VTAPNAPAFRELSRAECDAVLVRNHVGRIAFSFHDHVDIEPISFCYEEGWIYGRTADGTKLRTLAHNRWVAFETDEINAMNDWRSVVIKGALYILEAGGAPYEHALGVLRKLSPEVLSERDPFPDRTVVFRVHADQVTGRTAK
jgi:uncharacterized protein